MKIMRYFIMTLIAAVSLMAVSCINDTISSSSSDTLTFSRDTVNFDTVFTDLDDNEGFEAEVRQNKAMGFDGKSLINPKQIRLVHELFAPTEKEVVQAEAMVRAFREAAAAGIGVFTVNGKMVDVAFIPGAERTLKLAKACGMYEGDLV